MSWEAVRKLKVLEAMRDPANFDYFMGLASQLPGVDIAEIIAQAQQVDMWFLGINLSGSTTSDQYDGAGAGSPVLVPVYAALMLGAEPG